MTGKELLERGIRRGIQLWRIEDQLDWQENQGPRWAEDDMRKQCEPTFRRWAHDAVSGAAFRVFPEMRGPKAMGRSPHQPVMLVFGWFFDHILALIRFRRGPQLKPKEKVVANWLPQYTNTPRRLGPKFLRTTLLCHSGYGSSVRDR